jgi:hypothetical protein
VTRGAVQAMQGAGKLLSIHAAQPACARAAFEAVLTSDSATTAQRWGALLGLQSLVVATSDPSEVIALFESNLAEGMHAYVAPLYVLDAAAGAKLDSAATVVAARLGTSYTAMSPTNLWLLGQWEFSRANAARVAEIAAIARSRLDSLSAAQAAVPASLTLLARSMEARATLLAGDTARAVEMLRALRPIHPRNTLTWGLFEALANERMLLARTLLARGAAREAERVASQLDAPEPVTHVLFLRQSLMLRREAAERMQDRALATLYQRRVESLGKARGGDNRE